VYADEKTSAYHCRTNKDGYFEFQVPITTKKIIIESGDGNIFMSEVAVDLKSGQTIQLAGSETILDCRGRMVYIAGAFDKIEAIVHDSFGCPITQITNADLTNASSLNNYDAIFINCGASNPLDSTSYVNLQNFVAQGGSLYVSDFAVCYLLGNYSGTCTRTLGFVDDNKLCTIKSGASGVVSNVAVNARAQCHVCARCIFELIVERQIAIRACGFCFSHKQQRGRWWQTNQLRFDAHSPSRT
jgi:hypothetical protein